LPAAADLLRGLHVQAPAMAAGLWQAALWQAAPPRNSSRTGQAQVSQVLQIARGPATSLRPCRRGRAVEPGREKVCGLVAASVPAPVDQT
jgi:hypothetical protein